MSSIESNKNLAGIGAILLALGSLVPAAGAVLGIVGIILLLIGIKGIASYYNDNAIYQNAFWGIIFGVIALVAVGAVLGAVIWGSIFSSMTSAASLGAGLGVTIFGIILLIVGLIVVFIFYLLAALYFRKAFSALAQKSGEHMFETAGLFLLIGAFLTLVLVGLVLIFIAWLLVAVAFFSIKTPGQPYTYAPQPTASPSSSAANRYCPNCGAPVASDAAFCSHCGKQLT
jgi:uncharacterized membrane protein